MHEPQPRQSSVLRDFLDVASKPKDPLKDYICVRDITGGFLSLDDIHREVVQHRMSAIPNRAEVARTLGMGRSSLYRKLEDWGLWTRTPRSQPAE